MRRENLSSSLCQKRTGEDGMGLLHYRSLFQSIKQQFISKLALKAVK